MQKTVLAIAMLCCILFSGCGAVREDYPVQPVPFTDVSVDDAFWSPRMETNRAVTIPYAFQQCEETHRIDNFAVAGGLKQGTFEGLYFNDSDVYKIVEGAAYSLRLHPDPELETYVDGVIDRIEAAQEEDGYLYTSRTILNPDNMPPGGKERWSSIQWGHELYCAGHLYEAAVAYCQATGKRKLLDVALKNADLIGRVFGPKALRYPPGHQEIEIGLVKLYRHTGEKQYLDLARFFLKQRGDSTGHELYGEYAQDHKPVSEQDRAVGHAVRAAYMYTGMADVAALTGEREMIRAVLRIWEDVVGRKLYITGGIGATGGNEGFSEDYLLPNASAYCETCASIANVLWNHRLFLMTGDSRHMDIVERVLYNSFLSGISMEGDRFFYPNRLQTFSGAERSPWFECACCPSNIVRFIPSIPGTIYGVRGNDLYVSLYIGGRADVRIRDQKVQIVQTTGYPFEETVRFTIRPEKSQIFTLCLRIPGWVQGRPVPGELYRYLDPSAQPVSISINGENKSFPTRKGYARIRRLWKEGDEVELILPMSIRRAVALDSVEADRNRVAVERGPLVFCAEGPDQSDGMVRHLLLPDDVELSSRFVPGLLRGVHRVQAGGFGVMLDRKAKSYREPRIINFIPYYAWAHRGRHEMSVWLGRREEGVLPLHPPSPASMARVSVSFGRNPEAVQDQLDPRSSIDHDVPYFHWWPHKGSTEFIQYEWDRPMSVASAEVYWFDDEGIGECRIPKSWRLLIRTEGGWKPVENRNGYPVGKDRFDRVTFKPVTTRAVRLVVDSQEGWAGGIHEWRVR